MSEKTIFEKDVGLANGDYPIAVGVEINGQFYHTQSFSIKENGYGHKMLVCYPYVYGEDNEFNKYNEMLEINLKEVDNVLLIPKR